MACQAVLDGLEKREGLERRSKTVGAKLHPSPPQGMERDREREEGRGGEGCVCVCVWFLKSYILSNEGTVVIQAEKKNQKSTVHEPEDQRMEVRERDSEYPPHPPENAVPRDTREKAKGGDVWMKGCVCVRPFFNGEDRGVRVMEHTKTKSPSMETHGTALVGGLGRKLLAIIIAMMMVTMAMADGDDDDDDGNDVWHTDSDLGNLVP